MRSGNALTPDFDNGMDPSMDDMLAGLDDTAKSSSFKKSFDVASFKGKSSEEFWQKFKAFRQRVLDTGANARVLILTPHDQVGLFNQVMAIVGGVYLAALTSRAPLASWKSHSDLSNLFATPLVSLGDWDAESQLYSGDPLS